MTKIDEVRGKWTHVELPVRFASEYIKYKLHGQCHTGGIFLDNIRIYREIVVSEMKQTVKKEVEDRIRIYNINGTLVGTFGDVPKGLPNGTYIIQHSSYNIKKTICQ